MRILLDYYEVLLFFIACYAVGCIGIWMVTGCDDEKQKRQGCFHHEDTKDTKEG